MLTISRQQPHVEGNQAVEGQHPESTKVSRERKMLTISLPSSRAVSRKTINKSAKFEIIQTFLPPSHEQLKGLPSKRTVLKVELLEDHQIYCLHVCICALLSPEILQDGAVKGLIILTVITS